MNLREFRKYNDYSAITLSLIFNTLIMVLACTEKNITLKSYSRMIILSCIFDYLFCAGAFVTVIDAVIKDGAFVVISDGLFRFFPINYHYLFISIHIYVVGLATCYVPIDYVYRYLLICRKREPTTLQLVIVVSICCLTCLFTTLVFLWAFGREAPAELYKYGKILTDEGIWTEADGSLVKFIGTDCSNPYLLFAIFLSGCVANIAYAIVIFLGYRIFKELNSMRNIVSSRTLKLQRSMTIVLVVKAAVPFLFATLPVLLVIVTVSMHINIENFGLWLVIVNSWIPVISPVSTLLLLGSYRQRISQGLRSSSAVNYVGQSGKLTAFQNSIIQNSRTM